MTPIFLTLLSLWPLGQLAYFFSMIWASAAGVGCPMILIVLAVVTPANSQGSSMAFMFRSGRPKRWEMGGQYGRMEWVYGTFQRNIFNVYCIYLYFYSRFICIGSDCVMIYIYIYISLFKYTFVFYRWLSLYVHSFIFQWKYTYTTCVCTRFSSFWPVGKYTQTTLEMEPKCPLRAFRRWWKTAQPLILWCSLIGSI